jgi:soluble lytic murein transglycosylase
MRLFWEMIIRGHWHKTAGLIAAGVVAAALASGQSLESLAQTYRKTPSAVTRAPLARFAAAHPSDTEGAQALLALGAGDLDRQNYDQAIVSLKAASKRLPALADYTAFFLATAQSAANRNSAVVPSLDPIWKMSPQSPLLAKSVVLAAEAEILQQQGKAAVELVRRYYNEIANPQADLLLGQASEALGDGIAAVTHYQDVYYRFPASSQASQAELALSRLRTSLGEKFPPPMPQVMLERASLLANGPYAKKAKEELEALLPQLGGPDRDMAQVRIGAADYAAKYAQQAYTYLKSLTVASPEADAERIYYLQACARRLDKAIEITQYADDLGRLHPKSQRRLDALVAGGNYFIVQNDVKSYEPLFRTCVDAFPGDPQAPYCHWRVVWSAYIQRRPEAPNLLREHLTRYPSSEKAAAALYFLGRSAEKGNSPGEAKAFYTEVVNRFPNYYHAALARERLADKTITSAPASTEAAAFVRGIRFPASTRLNFDTSAEAKVRLNRARLLVTAGFEELAENELSFGARKETGSNALAVELATMAKKRGADDEAIRYIKNFAPGYLSMPIGAAPGKFWQLAFPLPYRATLETVSRERDLDPYIVAALIRQESEFNPKAISPKKAYGLTQVLPSTGREISRKIGIKPFSTRMLLQPDTNLKLGAYYLRSMLDQFGGKWDETLAAYNAGRSRVLNWRTFGTFEEPAEFIESIPFRETRDYVQIVMRNADLYRRLYGSGPTAVLSSNGLSSN